MEFLISQCHGIGCHYSEVVGTCNGCDDVFILELGNKISPFM